MELCLLFSAPINHHYRCRRQEKTGALLPCAESDTLLSSSARSSMFWFRSVIMAVMAVGLILTAVGGQEKKPTTQKAPPAEASIYKLGPDSEEHPDTPKGQFLRREHKSKIFANTDRDIG